MSDESTSTDERTAAEEESALSPIATGVTIVKSGWSTLKTVYYANSISWRFLKAGTLMFFGFFLWAGSNVLHSYNPDLALLQYPMAYGFVLILYGPLHHLVVLPLAFRWRRKGGSKRRVGRRLPNTMLTGFVILILVLGTFPAGAMTVDFNAGLESGSSDTNPDVLCDKSQVENETEINCSLTDSEEVDRVVVMNDGSQLRVVEDRPYEFTIREHELEAVTGEKQFRILLESEDGTMIRRYTRRLSMIDEG